MSETAPETIAGSKQRETIGTILLALAILLLLSFISHNPGDNAIHSVSDEAISNWISRFGAFAADIGLRSFGFAAYSLPILLGILSFSFFYGRPIEFRLRRLIGYAMLLCALCTGIAVLILGRVEQGQVVEFGGIVGYYLGVNLEANFGQIGALVVLFAATVVSAITTFDFSFAQSLQRVFGGAGEGVGRVRERWSKYQDERLERAAQRAQDEMDLGDNDRDGGNDGPVIHGRVDDDEGDSFHRVFDRDEDDHFDLDPTSDSFIDDLAQEVSATFMDADFEMPTTKAKKRKVKAIGKANEVGGKGAGSKAHGAANGAVNGAAKVNGAANGAANGTAEPTIKAKAEPAKPEQIEFLGFPGPYRRPPFNVMADFRGQNLPVDKEAILASSRVLEKKLEDFNVKGRVVNVHPGPIITMYEFEPAPGIKVNKIANLEDDLAMVLRAESIRIIAPIPGKGAVGIEVPNSVRETIYLRELIESKAFQEAQSPLTIAVGKDINGQPVVQDLAKMPHMLVAGTTGSGKSVFINSVITSILYKASPEQVRLVLVDPKMLELSDYAGVPHLLCPVCTQPKKAAAILRWAVGEMESRYRRMAEANVRNVASYNKKVEKLIAQAPKDKPPVDHEGNPLEKLPYIVVIIDELADLMMVASKDIEESIARLAQMARAAGIHLILATQRPSVDVVTGVIKANFPARISFKVSSKIDSRTILDTQGAHLLLGNGDMLYLPPTSSRIQRIHGCWINEEEVQEVVKYLKEHGGEEQYDEKVVAAIERQDQTDSEGTGYAGDDEVDPEFDKAVELVARERKASVSYIQRRLKIGYNRAARIMEMMEREGMVGPSDGTSRPRDVYLPPPHEDDD
ncbi:MAG: DNA translocase FtsK 4TM domain-containing protein [Deltaproteobacteria bacterium]|nr:DNA translocase FtsK 4TM domain-containing protein [Deltaproteobacteria bacterium]